MSDYEILKEELEKITDKWAKRLAYQSGNKKDVHDCLLCSTIIYEIEKALQQSNIRIAEQRQEEYFKGKEEQDSTNNLNNYNK